MNARYSSLRPVTLADMEPYERAAESASTLELRVDSYVVRDNLGVEDYSGPRLIVIAHAGKLVVIPEGERVVVDLAPERMQYLVELAVAAEHEPYRAGVDTAIARPITTYQLRVERMRRHYAFTSGVSVNHYGVRALGPRWSALIVALRDALTRPPNAAAAAWDFAIPFLGPIALGADWDAGAVVRLPTAVCSFEHAGPVYLRVGQPPERSALYRYDGELVSLGDENQRLDATPLVDWHERSRWILPCGGGTVIAGHEWQRPPRIVVHAIDPARPFYVQR